MPPEQTQAIIIEDSRYDVDFLEQLVRADGRLTILGNTGRVDEGLKMIHDTKPGLVFLDIELKDGNAFDLLEKLPGTGYRPTIIFTTGFNEYAIKAIRHAALDYLLKPIDPEELGHAINRYLEASLQSISFDQLDKLLHRIDNRQKIKINTITGFILIHPDEIIYCQAEGNYTDIICDDEKVITTSINLGRLEKLLPLGQFFRIHRSVVINLGFLSSVNRQKKRCYLDVNGNEMEFCIPTKRIKKLEEVV